MSSPNYSGREVEYRLRILDCLENIEKPAARVRLARILSRCMITLEMLDDGMGALLFGMDDFFSDDERKEDWLGEVTLARRRQEQQNLRNRGSAGESGDAPGPAAGGA